MKGWNKDTEKRCFYTWNHPTPTPPTQLWYNIHPTLLPWIALATPPPPILHLEENYNKDYSVTKLGFLQILHNPLRREPKLFGYPSVKDCVCVYTLGRCESSRLSGRASNIHGNREEFHDQTPEGGQDHSNLLFGTVVLIMLLQQKGYVYSIYLLHYY